MNSLVYEMSTISEKMHITDAQGDIFGCFVPAHSNYKGSKTANHHTGEAGTQEFCYDYNNKSIIKN